MIAALLPIVLLTIPSFNFVTQKLYNQLQGRLEQASEQLGLAIEERLEFIASEMLIIASDPDLKGYINQLHDHTKLKKRLSNWFRGLTVIRPLEPPVHLLEPLSYIPTISKNEYKQLNKGKALLSIKQFSEHTDIYIYQLLNPSQPADGVIIGAINPQWLWQLHEVVPEHALGCILNNELIPLTCTHPMDAKNLGLLADKLLYTKKGSMQVEVNDKSYIQTYWNNFNEESLLPPEWIVIVSAPASLALSPIGNFAIIFPLFLILAATLVLLLSFKQIQRVVIPLEKLREGTKNIANKQFNSPVILQSGDEFEELARSFNIMSSRLSKQFNALETMARIDRMILSTLDMRNIVETILFRMGHAVPCEEISILILDDKDPSKAKLYFREAKLSSDIRYNEVTLKEEDLTLFNKNRRSLFLDKSYPKPIFLSMLLTTDASFLCLPIYLNDKLTAVIILGYSNEPNYTHEDLNQARDLADRVAVALSNAAWEEKLYKNAHYDSLTGLPNRLLFQDRIHHALKRADREKSQVALMFLDLDHFKTLNDSMGHTVGDEFLRETAIRLKSSVRNIDTIARLGGDEFTIILPDLHNSESTIADVSAIASKILRKTAVPYKINGQEIVLTASIGIALYPTDANNYSDLLKVADAALYYAKGKGKSNYQFYSEDIDAEAKKLIKLENDLKRALIQNEFELYYQPRIDITTNTIVGAEALLRWHADDRLISPKEFIPIAEDNGLILTLGEWVIKKATLACRQWHDLGFEHLVIAVNLSAHQFRDGNLPLRIETALHDARLHPGHLELEITESTLMADMDKAIHILKQFRLSGMRIAIDDFGTGYSSLNYLKKFPVDILKIDQSFIRNIHNDRDNAAIVSAIITLALHLDLGIVAEGVETLEELNKLKQQACKEVQGFVFSKPLSEAEFLNYLYHYQNQPANDRLNFTMQPKFQ